MVNIGDGERSAIRFDASNEAAVASKIDEVN